MKFNYISKGKFCYVVSSILWQCMKWVILLKWFTTTKMESKPRWILGYHKTKSILTSSRGAQATSRESIRKMRHHLKLACKHTIHL